MIRLVGFESNLLPKQINVLAATRWSSSKADIKVVKNADDEPKKFRVLNLTPPRYEPVKRIKQADRVIKHRYQKMSVTQNWGDVWPAPRTFHPSTVPLPIRQGYREPDDHKPTPDKFANAELMKIPNFLHLTPPVIQRQCEALKKFCTSWPVALDTDEKCDKHFPIEYITSDYCQGLPTIRNPLARIITLRLKLSALPLDKHARDKFLRLVEDRYDPETDYVTLVVDRCPLRQQNYDYARYLLTALFYESFKIEQWEALKSEADMEYYDWQRNKSKEVINAILAYGDQSGDASKKSTDAFAASVELLFNDGENEQNLLIYKNEVLKLLDLKKE